MLAHLHRSLSLLEICEVVGASERTLLYSFRERTGQSPKAYLSALKLNRLRQDLKEADPRVDSVHAWPFNGAWCTLARSPLTIAQLSASCLTRHCTVKRASFCLRCQKIKSRILLGVMTMNFPLG